MNAKLIFTMLLVLKLTINLLPAQEVLFPLPHRGPVIDVAFTPDGRKIITLSEDKTIKIHDFTTRATLKTIDIDDGEPLSLSILPGGKTFIYSTTGSGHVIDIETEKEIQTLKGLSGRIVLNNSYITAGTYNYYSADDTLSTGKNPRIRYDNSLKKVNSIQLTPSEQLIERQYTTNCNSCGYDAGLLSNDKLVYMNGDYLFYFNIAENKNVDSIYINSEFLNYAFCFSLDEEKSRVFIPSAKGIMEYNSSGDSVRFLPIVNTTEKASEISAYRLYFNKGKHFICNSNGSLLVVDDVTGKLLFSYTNKEWIDESSEGIISLAFHPYKNIVAVGFEKKNYIMILDMENKVNYKFESINTSPVRKIKVSEKEDEIYIDTRFSGTILNLKNLTKSLVLKNDHQDSDVDFKTGNLVAIDNLSNKIAWNNARELFKKDTVRWLPTFGKNVSFLSSDSVIVSLGSGDASGAERADVNVLSEKDILNPGYPFNHKTLFAFRTNLDNDYMDMFNRLIVAFNKSGELKYLNNVSEYPDVQSFELFPERYKKVYDMAVSTNQRYLLIIGESQYPYKKITVVNLKTGNHSFTMDSTFFSSVCFINDTTFLGGSADGTITKLRIDYTNKKFIKTGDEKFSDAGILKIKYLSVKKQFLISTNDNRLHFTNEKLKKLAYYFSTDDNNFIFIDSLNHYFASRDMAKNIYFRKNDKLFSFDQFDCFFNRPDLIVKSLFPEDSVQFRVYNELYKKRMKKAGLKEDIVLKEYDLPIVKIIDPERIPETTKNSKISADIEFDGNGRNLMKGIIWINDVPVEKFDCDKKKNFTKRADLELAPGINKIDISVTNTTGVESYKETFYTTYKPAEQIKPDLYLITIGDSKYKESQNNLTYASKDAKDIQSFFGSNKRGIYGNVISYRLIDEKVTSENIKKMKDELKNAGRNDVVVVTYAGHGMLDKKWDYYLSTYDIDFKNPSEKGLLYESLESLLDGIAPLKKILFIDACHSGEVDKDEMVQLVSNTKIESSGVQFRAMGSNVVKKNIGLRTSSELMKEMFADIRRGTGATVISSASAAEFAFEGEQWNNGLFTYCLLSGLKDTTADLNKDGEIKLSELQRFVGEKVYSLSKGLQKPASRIENSYMDFSIW